MYRLFLDAAPDGGMSLYSTVLIFAVMIAVVYFMVIRPDNKKKKAAEEMRGSLKAGDVITTIGGVVGTVCAVKDKTVVMETGADRVRIEFTKWAVSGKGAQTTGEAPAPDKKDKNEDS